MKRGADRLWGVRATTDAKMVAGSLSVAFAEIPGAEIPRVVLSEIRVSSRGAVGFSDRAVDGVFA